MLNKLSALFGEFNQLAVKDTSVATLPCIQCSNTSALLSQNDFRQSDRRNGRGKKQRRTTRCQRISLKEDARQKGNNQALQVINRVNAGPRIAAGRGILPAESSYIQLSTQLAEAIKAAALLFTPAPQRLAGVAQHNHGAAMLTIFDGALTRIVNQLLPWGQASASPLPQSASATYARPPVRQNLPDYRIHQRGKNSTLFRQQFNEFLVRIHWQPEEPLQQWLLDKLYQQDAIFIYPGADRLPRPQRAHEDEMRRMNILMEMVLRDKTLSVGGVGAKIIAWADERTEKGYTLFRQGFDSYNPLCFLASGGEVLMGHFVRLIGEAYGGTLLERLPGETQVQRAQRLALNIMMTPDQIAAKAFSGSAIAPIKPLLTPALKPVNKLPGTVISHSPTGMALHSVLQAEIARKSWHLYPLSESQGVAVRPGVQPEVRRAATRNQHNQWHINGIEGEHGFAHGKTLQWLIRAEDFWYPVKFSAQDGIAELANGMSIYFHELSQQWKLYYAGNPHLQNRVLAVLPEGISSSELGPQRVLVSTGHQQSEVWSEALNGIQYLKVRTQQGSQPGAENRYVSGRLEGDFFSVISSESQAVYHQRVLKWQAAKQQWMLADSPFSLLRLAEEHLDHSWLRQIVDPQEHLIVVHNRPGLYRSGKDYFLRWQSDAGGVEKFLPLEATTDARQYRTPQAAAESEIYFRYDETSARWQFLPLTSEAFFGLPQSVKVQEVPQFSAAPDLAEYRHLYFCNNEMYLHTGADSQGRKEFIRVKQDAEDSDLFSLRVPGEGEPDSQWLFRFDNEEEQFELEERRECLPRIKRADEDQVCAGPSGISKPSLSDVDRPPVKKPRLPQYDPEQSWLSEQTRLPDELLRMTDSRVAKSRKNLAYALRLNLTSPESVSVNGIARYAGVTVRRLSAFLSRVSPEAAHFLITHPPIASENHLGYALRLYRLFDGLTPRILADYTGAKESRIITNLHQFPADKVNWLRRHPRYPDESKMDYAVRLYQLPEGGSSITFIAAHAGVDELVLRRNLEGGLSQGQSWLNSHSKNAGESDMDYAVRLYQQPHENVSVEMIAGHAGINKVSFLQRLGQRWKEKQQQEQEGQWLKAYPRNDWESNFGYALRLTRLRDQQVATGSLGNKMVRNNIIAIHAHLSPRIFNARLYDVKITRQWFNNHPRLAQERLAGIENLDAIAERNKQYALRLFSKRYLPARKIKTSAIAAHVGVTETQLNVWILEARFEWFSHMLRLPEEISADNADELAIQHNNQRYARRLTTRREEENMYWLINDQHIASYADVTLRSFRLAQDPLLVLSNPQPASAVKSEPVWQPERDLLHLQLKQNPPLLADPKNPKRSVTREVISGPVVISNIKQVVKGLPKAQQQEVAQRFLRQAQELVESDGARQDFFYDDQGNQQPGLLSHKLQIFYNEQAPQLGLQILAKEDFEPYELVGVYTGSWHPDEASFRQECRKMGSQPVLTYLWGDYDGVGSVSAYQNANKLALVNTAKLTEEPASPTEQKNNLAVLYINGKLPAYYTTQKIVKGEPLLISYGNYYSATYLIQSALNHDIIRIITREKKCYFVIKGMGNQNAAILGPEGLLKTLPENVQPYILQERLDKRGILRYDALHRKSERKIANSKDNENNLYHAMAKAMHPQGGLDIINQEIAEMIRIKTEVYANEESVIKPEPDEQGSIR